MLRSDLCDDSDAYIVTKATITVTDPGNTRRNKIITFKIMHHLSNAFQKSVVYKLTM